MTASWGQVAYAAPPSAYSTTARVTPGGALNKALAFQNTSATLDVVVRKIEVMNASTYTVTGGLMSYWVYFATSVSHSPTTGVNGIDSYNYADALATAPSYISASTAPYNVIFEGNSGILTDLQQASSGYALPVIRPLIVNNDEAATANFADSWQEELNTAKPLTLEKNTQRALIFEQRRVGTADITEGNVILRIFYTVR